MTEDGKYENHMNVDQLIQLEGNLININWTYYSSKYGACSWETTHRR